MDGVNNNDFNLLAKNLFNHLDAKDSGGKDGQIEASIWNDIVVGENGIRNNAAAKKSGSIFESIGEEDAVRSLRGYLSHAYYENKDKFNSFLQQFGVDPENFTEPPSDPDAINAGGGNGEGGNVGDEEAGGDVGEDIEVTEDSLPSVLLRNTALIGAAQIIKAIKNPAFRKELSLKFTPEEKAAFDEACKKYDEAKKASATLKNDAKKGRADARNARSQVRTIEEAEKKFEKAGKDLKAAQDKVKHERELLKNNTKYQTTKSEYEAVQKEIQSLEAKRKSNKSQKLSKANEARLQELKGKKAALEKEIGTYETNLRKAESELKTAGKNYKDAKIEKQSAASEEGIKEAKGREAKAKAEMEANPKYKDAKANLKKVNTEINQLKKKSSLTPKETARLKELEAQKAKLNKEIGKLAKDYNAARAETKAAEAQAKTLKKATEAKPGTAKEALLKKVKKGNNKVRINVKKMPKAKRAQFTSLKASAKAASKGGARALRGLGKVAKPLMVIISAVDIYNAYEQGGKKQAMRTAAKLGVAGLSAWAAGAAGAKIGATVGALAGPVGAGVGAIVGGIAGGIAGWWAGEKAYDAGEKVVFSEEQIDQIGGTGTVEVEMTDEEIYTLLEEDPEVAEYMDM